MTEDRDPDLQAFFASANEDLPGQAFTAGEMTGTRLAIRWKIFARIAAAMAFVACAWVLFLPLQSAVALLVHGLTTPLIAIENPLVSQLLLPVNSVAFPLAMAWLVLRRVRRRLLA